MGSDQLYNVLFLCTGNSARSIFAEAMLNRLGRGRFRAFSAGSHPEGEVHPLALDLLRRLNFSTEGVRSKGWEGSRARLHRAWTSCSPSAIERPARSARCGQASR